MKAKARLAVDIGGTFTDVVLEKPDGARATAKVLTTPRAPEEGFLAGAAAALADAGLAPSDIGVILHGTTLATNALIEKRGARTALLVTEGHRDSLEMAYENRFEQYDISIDRPPPLVPRWLRLPIRERMNARGEVLVPLDEKSVLQAIGTLDAEGVESVAVGFLHAYANPAHERRVAELLKSGKPSLSVTLASETAPEIREYERQTTAVANAYVRPLMERYLRELAAALTARGFACPVLLMTSGGGLCTLDTAARFPIRLIESGPAGGAVLAATMAKSLGRNELLSFDMGGTTAKLCLIDQGEPASARMFEVDRSYRFKKGSGMPVRIPVIEMVEIGAGGGSLARVDALKRIAVGPESAGSEPGPACYGRGGDRASVTDADLVLGRIDPPRFAGGAIPLDAAAAEKAVRRCVGEPLRLSDDIAALGVCEVVDEAMASAARAHAAEQGKDIRQRTMIAFGGAAPLHAARLAEKLGVSEVVVPKGAGVGSAIGFLLAPASFEIIRSLPMRLDAFNASAVAALFDDSRRDAEAVVRAAAGDAPLIERLAAYMRYAGQGYEIETPVTRDGLDAGALAGAFEAAYRALYGRTIPGMPVEALTWSLRLTAPAPAPPALAQAKPLRRRVPSSTRDAVDTALGERTPFAVFERTDLAPGDFLDGPALIVESQTTTVVSSAFRALIDQAENVVLQRRMG